MIQVTCRVPEGIEADCWPTTCETLPKVGELIVPLPSSDAAPLWVVRIVHRTRQWPGDPKKLYTSVELVLDSAPQTPLNG